MGCVIVLKWCLHPGRGVDRKVVSPEEAVYEVLYFLPDFLCWESGRQQSQDPVNVPHCIMIIPVGSSEVFFENVKSELPRPICINCRKCIQRGQPGTLKMR